VSTGTEKFAKSVRAATRTVREAQASKGSLAENFNLESFISNKLHFFESETDWPACSQRLRVRSRYFRASIAGRSLPADEAELREDLERIEQEASDALRALYDEYLTLANEYDTFEMDSSRITFRSCAAFCYGCRSMNSARRRNCDVETGRPGDSAIILFQSPRFPSHVFAVFPASGACVSDHATACSTRNNNQTQRPRAGELAARIAAWAAEHQINLFVNDRVKDLLPAPSPPPPERLVDNCDLLIALGGDGTMISTARLVAGRGTPVLWHQSRHAWVPHGVRDR